MRQIELAEAARTLPDLLEAAVNGDSVVIVRGDKAAVRLVAVKPGERRPRFGSARGLISIADDFDAPLPDFDEYTH